MTNNEVFQIKPNYDLERAKETVSAKLDPSWIEKRRQGSVELSYIGGHVVIRLLNKAFNYQWSFEVIKEEIVPSLPKAVVEWQNKKKVQVLDGNGQPMWEPQPPVVKVLGRLSVPGLGVKEQYGSKVLIGGATEQESAFKSASTDALKKCASLFGIGLDLYGEVSGFEESYEYTAPSQPIQQAPVQQQSQPVQQQQPVQAQPVQQAPEQPVYTTAAQAQQNGELATQQQTALTNQSETANQQPANQAHSAGPARQFSWPPAEVQKMIELKNKLGVTDNDHLTPYVREFLNNPEVTIQNITPDNIAAFNVFLNSKLQ